MVSRRLGWVLVLGWLLGASALAAAQVTEETEDAVIEDDSHMAVVPNERVDGPNPSDAHAALMAAIDGEDIAGSTSRANLLAAARRVAPMDLLWGVGR